MQKLGEQQRPEVEPLRGFLERANISRTTAWRMRQRGWLKTVSIGSQIYIRKVDIEEFLERAARGEFASIPATQKTEAA